MPDVSEFRLKVFQKAARSLSFTEAAKELYISQPAVTKHIRELEAVYGAALFDRSGGRIALTDAGRLLLRHCDVILTEYNRLSYGMSRLTERRAGTLEVAASLTIAQYILPRFLAAFNRRYPGIALTVHARNTSEIEDMLCERRIDVGLIEGASRRPELKYVPFLKDEIVTVVRSGAHALPAGSPEPQKIAGLPLVMREPGSGTSQVIEARLSERGIRSSMLDVRMHVGCIEGIKTCVMCSDWAGMLSVYAVSRELAAGIFRIVDFKDFSIERDFCFVRRQGDESEPGRTFTDFISARVREEYGAGRVPQHK